MRARPAARRRSSSASVEGTMRSTSVAPWGSTVLDMRESSWPGDGEAEGDEDDRQRRAERALRHRLGQTRAEQDAGHGAGHHGAGEGEVDAPRVEVAERGHDGQ